MKQLGERMPKQQTEPHQKSSDQFSLETEVWKEIDLMSLLGIKNKQQMNSIRGRGLPYVPILKTVRVYIARDVLEYLKGKQRVAHSEDEVVQEELEEQPQASQDSVPATTESTQEAF